MAGWRRVHRLSLCGQAGVHVAAPSRSSSRCLRHQPGRLERQRTDT